MSNAFDQIAQGLNEQGAEITALRTVLFGLVSRIVIAGSTSAETQLEQMESDAIGILKRTPMNPQNNAAQEKLAAELAERETKKFFRRLAIAVSEMKRNGGSRNPN